MEQSPPIAAEVPRGWERLAVLLPLFALVSAIGGALPSFSLGANLLVLATGGTLFWLGLTGRGAPRARSGGFSRRAAWWLLPVVSLGGVELANFLLGSTYDHPTLSKLADPVLDDYFARCAAYFGWLTAFWRLVRR